MFQKYARQVSRQSRVRRIRSKVVGTSSRPRLSVYRSLRFLSAQIIDDTTGTTLAMASDRGISGTRLERAKEVGRKIAEDAKKQKITDVVFDRAGYQYHGRVAAFAEGARQGGLNF